MSAAFLLFIYFGVFLTPHSQKLVLLFFLRCILFTFYCNVLSTNHRRRFSVAPASCDMDKWFVCAHVVVTERCSSCLLFLFFVVVFL